MLGRSLDANADGVISAREFHRWLFSKSSRENILDEKAVKARSDYQTTELPETSPKPYTGIDQQKALIDELSTLHQPSESIISSEEHDMALASSNLEAIIPLPPMVQQSSSNLRHSEIQRDSDEHIRKNAYSENVKTTSDILLANTNEKIMQARQIFLRSELNRKNVSSTKELDTFDNSHVPTIFTSHNILQASYTNGNTFYSKSEISVVENNEPSVEVSIANMKAYSKLDSDTSGGNAIPTHIMTEFSDTISAELKRITDRERAILTDFENSVHKAEQNLIELSIKVETSVTEKVSYAEKQLFSSIKLQKDLEDKLRADKEAANDRARREKEVNDELDKRRWKSEREKFLNTMKFKMMKDENLERLRLSTENSGLHLLATRVDVRQFLP